MNKQISNLQDHFSCYICYEQYNALDRFPRVLSCGHNFCERCIAKIIERYHQFKCPVCNTSLGQLRMGLTYKNYTLLDLMNINGIKGTKSAADQLSYSIVGQTYDVIVNEMIKAPKHVRRLVIKRLRDDEKNPFDSDLIRSNKHSMRFYKLLIKFYRLKHFQLWVKYSAHGFEECLAQSLCELQELQSIRIVNAYDEYDRLRELISLVSNSRIQFDIRVEKWQG